MGVQIADNTTVIKTGPKTFHYDLSKDVYKKLKYEIHFIIKYNESLAKHTIKNDIS